MKLLFSLLLSLISCHLIIGQENNAILCSDGIDNDSDGLIDCNDPECVAIPNLGCATCGTGQSFADVVLDYQSGCPISDPFPDGALGVSDYAGLTGDEPEFVILGDSGILKLGFTDNIVSNSGDSQVDIFIFEIGIIEPMSISLRPKNAFTETALINSGLLDSNGDGFYFITNLLGATSEIDIDAVVSGYSIGELYFDAIEIVDNSGSGCQSITPGADIDAVCAIFSIDCSGSQNGNAIFDDCGECLDLDDPNFNQSCADCAGTPNGTAIIDDCGECIEPDDPNFNQSCTDCFGVLNGTAVLDDCGQCLEPGDPTFNESCKDCLGVANGIAVFDDCGECLEPDDLSYNQSCTDCMDVLNGTAILDDCGECLEPDDARFNKSCIECDIYIPNIFSPNNDGQNDYFRIYGCQEVNLDILELSIYDRWGELVFQQKNYQTNSSLKGWDGKFSGKEINTGVYVYNIKILNNREEEEFYSGTITLIK